MSYRVFAVVFLSTVVSSLSNTAFATVIDFEGFAMGTIIDDEYAPNPTTSAMNIGGGPDLAVVFDTENPTGGDTDLGAPFGTNNPGLSGNYHPGNVLILQENGANCNGLTCTIPDDEGSRPAGTFFFDFGTVITLESIDFLDIETIESGAAIKLFDDADIEIMPGTFFTPDTGGDNMWDQIVFNVSGVKRIELNMGGSGAIDNITFTAIPVPAAVWLFASGLIGLLSVARRKARHT